MGHLLEQMSTSGLVMEEVPCNLCGANDASLIYEARERVHGLPGIFRIVRCARCGLAYLNPRPVAAFLNSYYPENYHTATNTSIYSNLVSFLETFAVKGNNFLAKIVRKFLLFYGRIAWRILAVKPPASTILDIGCGLGNDLFTLTQFGWHGLGIETSKTACVHAAKRGLKVFNGRLEQADLQPESFDVALFNHVLNHLPDPLDSLKRVHKALKPDGILVLCLPNFSSVATRIFRERHYPLDVPRHLYFFDRRSLQNLVKKAGFRITRLRTSTAPSSLIFSLAIAWNDVWKRNPQEFPLTSLRLTLGSLFLMALLTPITLPLDLMGQGENFIVELRKDLTTP